MGRVLARGWNVVHDIVWVPDNRNRSCQQCMVIRGHWDVPGVVVDDIGVNVGGWGCFES